MKICTKCKLKKEQKDFSKNKKTRDGLKYECKLCSYLRFRNYCKLYPNKAKNYWKKYRVKNIDFLKDYKKKYDFWHKKEAKESEYRRRLNYPQKYLFMSVKKRAKNKKLDFNLCLEDIKIPLFCPVLNIPLIFDKNGRTDNSPSVDRINNSKGYIKGNIIIVSWRVNYLKNNAKLQELQMIVKFYENLDDQQMARTEVAA